MNDEINKSTYNSLRKHIGLPEVNRNEIKEILDWLRDISTPTGLSYSGDRTLSNSMVDKIVDYITNLQQQLHQASLDIQELTERDIGCPSWCDKLTNLQQEYESLKDYYMSMVKIASKRLDRYLDYKSRIEKAIDKLTIKQARFINEKDYVLDDNDLDEIMYILQNGSDDSD